MGASGSQYADVPQCPRTEGWTAVCTEQRRGCRLGLDLHGLLSRPSVVYVGTIIVLVIASLRWFGEDRRDSDLWLVAGSANRNGGLRVSFCFLKLAYGDDLLCSLSVT